ncbi:hypothetical protein YC2023_098500 [Brassica napus]
MLLTKKRPFFRRSAARLSACQLPALGPSSFSAYLLFACASICQLRMKDMVSICRRKRKQPNWIHDTLWEEMTAYWDTSAAKKKK